LMTGFELKLWRRGMHWDQERAAEELGVSVRSYKRYEKAQNIAKLIELATFALSTKNDKGIG
ncbi:helix-turn-helix domain-containing protein, partial [Providencia hangzhouensis]|uniref:helix-turn-helix domain-containing protein n=2 Tax=Morganellaceae TaxID=1903414 RepID=UPI0034DDAE43